MRPKISNNSRQTKPVLATCFVLGFLFSILIGALSFWMGATTKDIALGVLTMTFGAGAVVGLVYWSGSKEDISFSIVFLTILTTIDGGIVYLLFLSLIHAI